MNLESAFKRTVDRTEHHDVVIVGTGVAGLTAALGCAPRTAALLTKADGLGSGGSSAMAQGGVAAAMGEGDSAALHASDTMAAGAGLCDPEVVGLLTNEGRDRVRRLIELGALFDRDETGRLVLGREAAHSQRRILHARGDATGAELVRTLVEAVERAPEVEIFTETAARELVMHDGRVVGVLAERRGQWVLHRARSVVLATGGLGQLYSHTTNPVENTGDGLAMAARVGARLVDLEMVQFHPTALAGADPMPLMTEALRGEGAVLVDQRGERFMPAVHADAELAPRDVVARAIWRLREEGGEAYLDARQAVGERFPSRFPTVFSLCSRHGIDPRTEPIPVSPAVHYHMGGIAVDLDGRSSVAGLWAAGEVASTGAHGANRLASNSLLEAMVFGARVARDLRRNLGPACRAELVFDLPPCGQDDAETDALVRGELRSLMWRYVGVERDDAGLLAALSRLDQLAEQVGARPTEAGNMVWVARLVAAAALERRESRGSHFRTDCPESEERWRHRLYLRAGRDGTARFERPSTRRVAVG